jgi:hypothetical protein
MKQKTPSVEHRGLSTFFGVFVAVGAARVDAPQAGGVNVYAPDEPGMEVRIDGSGSMRPAGGTRASRAAQSMEWVTR